jgi:solute:Na+ symporter, SSS family
MDIVVLVLYLSVVLGIGIVAGRGLKSMEDFSVAGRSFNSLVVFATLSASFIGGGFSMGNAEKVFLFGIINIFALWGFSLKEILVALFIAPRMDKYPDAISVGDIMETVYGKGAKILTGIFSVILCAGILGAQVGAMGYIFNVFIGLPQIYGILIGVGIVIIYSTIGGMRSVVFTDILQFVLLGIGLPLTLFLGVLHVGGLSALVKAVPPSHFSLAGGGMTLTAFISLFLTFLLGETLVPPYVQRLFIARDRSDRIKGTLYSGIFSFPFFAVTGFIGLVALTLSPDLNPNLAMPFVIKEILPVGLSGLVIAGVVSIVMSSADSFLNAAAVAFVHDVIQPLKRTKLPGKDELFFARLTTLVVGILAVVFAISIKSILDILIYSYNFWSPILLVPLVFAIFGFKARREHFFIGAFCGALGVIVWNSCLHKPFGIDGLIAGVVFNLAAFLISYRMLGKKDVS